jgi:hypothetical protein
VSGAAKIATPWRAFWPKTVPLNLGRCTAQLGRPARSVRFLGRLRAPPRPVVRRCSDLAAPQAQHVELADESADRSIARARVAPLISLAIARGARSSIRFREAQNRRSIRALSSCGLQTEWRSVRCILRDDLSTTLACLVAAALRPATLNPAAERSAGCVDSRQHA